MKIPLTFSELLQAYFTQRLMRESAAIFGSCAWLSQSESSTNSQHDNLHTQMTKTPSVAVNGCSADKPLANDHSEEVL
jgi:hypothetical protein